MKRSMLMICALLALAVFAGPVLAADAPVPAEELDAEMNEAPATAEVETELVRTEGDFEAEVSSNLGTVDCLCTCASYIWSLDDVRTTGTCDQLVGQTCWNNWGQGTYIECMQDGGGFPF